MEGLSLGAQGGNYHYRTRDAPLSCSSRASREAPANPRDPGVKEILGYTIASIQTRALVQGAYTCYRENVYFYWWALLSSEDLPRNNACHSNLKQRPETRPATYYVTTYEPYPACVDAIRLR